MNKKGMEMTFGVIVTAIIALVIMVILIFLVVKNTSIFSQTVGDCEAKGGACVPSAAECKDLGGLPSFFSCKINATPMCCITTKGGG